MEHINGRAKDGGAKDAWGKIWWGIGGSIEKVRRAVTQGAHRRAKIGVKRWS